jgi:hypothetical protein
MIGARTVGQLENNLGCLEFTLTNDQMQRLDKVSQIELGFPHDFLTSDQIRDLVYGGIYTQLDNHRG